MRIGDVVACSGQAGYALDGQLADGLEAQTRQTFENISAALAASGAALGDVLKVTVYLTDPSQFVAMNQVYETVFEVPYPARTTIYVTLPPGMLVEIDALAVGGR